MLHRILPFLLLLVTSLSQAQQPQFLSTFVPDARIHDFGTIQERNGKVSHTFTLVNRGTKAVVISDVSAWCGCTTSSYTKGPVRPGRQAKVTVTYNPNRRPGRFSKEVAVITDGGRGYVRLWVKGRVVPYEHPVREDFPYAYGKGLYMGSEVLPFRRLRKGEEQHFSLRLANDTGKPMRIQFVREPDNQVLKMPRYVTLKPHQRVSVRVSYRAIREYDRDRWLRVYPVVNGARLRPLKVFWPAAKRR